MTKKQKIFIYTLVIAGVLLKLVAFLWEKQQKINPNADIQENTKSECNIKRCEFDNGVLVESIGNVSSKTPFEILISNVPPETKKAYIYFSMDSMDMGFNRFDLIANKERVGQWKTKPILLPICAINDDKYIMNICFDDCKNPHIIRFQAK